MTVGWSAGDGGPAGDGAAAAGEAPAVVLEGTGRPGFATRAGVDRLPGGGEGGTGA